MPRHGDSSSREASPDRRSSSSRDVSPSGHGSARERSTRFTRDGWEEGQTQSSPSREGSPEPTDLELRLARDQAAAGRRLNQPEVARGQAELEARVHQLEADIGELNQLGERMMAGLNQLLELPGERNPQHQASQRERSQEQAGQRRRSQEQAGQRGRVSESVERRPRVREKSQAGRGTYK